DLRSCFLKMIPAGIYTLLADLPPIATINASHNVIIKLTPKFFDNFTKITELTLSHNRLRAVPEELSLCGNLHLLDISYNRITALQPNMFLLPCIKIIRAGNNQITEVQTQDITAAKTLDDLDLHNNPLTTECHHELSKLQQPKVKLLPDHADELEKLNALKVAEATMSTQLQSNGEEPDEEESSDQNNSKPESTCSIQGQGPPPPAPPPPSKMPPPPPPPGNKFKARK
ncbi:unnamed protein product, partial [Meganyctiphanes norvegica]